MTQPYRSYRCFYDFSVLLSKVNESGERRERCVHVDGVLELIFGNESCAKSSCAFGLGLFLTYLPKASSFMSSVNSPFSSAMMFLSYCALGRKFSVENNSRERKQTLKSHRYAI